VKPIYREFVGWDKTCGVRTFNALPSQAQHYIKELEKIIGVKISMVSTSPERDDMIMLG
jgi:adenylosuccinate synthase